MARNLSLPELVNLKENQTTYSIILYNKINTLNAFTNTFEIYIQHYGESFLEMDFLFIIIIYVSLPEDKLMCVTG